MKSISILNQKGGVGKTTLSVNLASALALTNHSAILIDADPQGSSLDWAAARGDRKQLFPVIGCPKPTIHKIIVDIGTEKDFVIIDGAPRVTDLARSCIMASDLILIPVQPSPYDIWASEEIIELIKEATVYKPTLKAAFIINRRIPKTAIGRDVVNALRSFDIPVFETVLAQRVIFAESAAVGLSVIEQDPKSPAAKEVNALCDETFRFLEK